MRKKLPSEQGLRQFVYTAYSQHYNWSTVVRARTVQEARKAGLREVSCIFGNHARVHRDEVKEM